LNTGYIDTCFWGGVFLKYTVAISCQSKYPLISTLVPPLKVKLIYLWVKIF